MLQARSETVKGHAEPERREYGALDDDGLAHAARQDPAAFAELYQRYVEPVYGYCFLRLTNRQVAEDATSEVFVRALAGLNGYSGGIFSAWLFRIAHNVVINVYRRQRTTCSLDSADDPADPHPSPEGIALRAAERAELSEAIAQLPSDQRTVLELQLAGWTGQEIAGIAGRTAPAVKMLRYRAVLRLRDILTRTDRGRKERYHDV